MPLFLDKVEREDEFVKRFEELISSLEKTQKKSNSLNEKIFSSLKKLNHDSGFC